MRALSHSPEFASGWDFFGIGIFCFGLNRKIPKSRGSGSGFLNLEKIPSAKSRKSQNPGFLTIGIFSKFYENPRDFKQSPGFGIFFSLGIFIPRTLSKSAGFGIFQLRDFLSPGSGFFVGWDIPTKSQLWP